MEILIPKSYFLKLFTKMLKTLDVEIGNSDMSFAVTSNTAKDPEIKYSDISSFFANKMNIFSYRHYNLLFNINRFNKLSLKSLNSLKSNLNEITLNKFLTDNKFSRFFIENYIVPMGSSIWSCKPSQILQFPYLSYVNFMNNHGLLSISNQPQWHYIKNGSKTYVNSLKNYLSAEIRLNTEVTGVINTNNSVKVTSLNDEQSYDYVIYSNHPNEILNIGKNLDGHILILDLLNLNFRKVKFNKLKND